MLQEFTKESQVKSILVMTLSNVGDVVLTAPVIDILLRDFPTVKFTVIVSPKGKSLFDGHPHLEIVLFNKASNWREKLKLYVQLWHQNFDVIVDLRRTALGFLLPCRWRLPLFVPAFKGHNLEKHLNRLALIYKAERAGMNLAIIPSPVDLLKDVKGYILLAPTTADSAKRWSGESFAKTADALAMLGYPIVFSGDKADINYIEAIQRQMKNESISIAGQTNLRELFYVIKNSRAVIAHDSGTMHLASYANVPVLALFGPTDAVVSGPWSSRAAFVQDNSECPRCLAPKSKHLHNCMSGIRVDRVLASMKTLLS